jgi:uncharacterized protein involved in exopolysaccharide biosynthesis
MYNIAMKSNYTETVINKKTDMNLSLLKKGSNDWLVIVILMIIGALLGFGFSFFKKPIYEASALVTTNMALNEEGSVDEFMMDAQINHIGDLYYNSVVIEELIEREADKGINLDLETLKEIASIERRMLSTLVKIRHVDPKIAAQIASDWAEILYNKLQEAYPYALELTTAKNTLFLLENCGNPPEDVEPDAFCESMTKEEYDRALSEAKDIILKNSKKSLGLSEYLNVVQWQAAEIPTKALIYHRGSMVFAGSVIGLLIALVAIILRKSHD